jgi:integrase
MASVTKRNGRWQATYRGPDGRERTKTFDKKDDAENWNITQQADLLRGTWVDPSAGRTTLRAFAEVWLSQQPHWRDGTRHAVDNSLRVHILPVLGDRPLGSIRRSDVQALVGHLDHLAPSTVATVHQHLRTVLGAAVEDGRIVRNPAVGVRLPEVVRPPIVPLSAEQVWALAEAAPPTLRAAVMLGAGLGLRQGETLGLTVDRVDWLRRQVRIDRQMVTPAAGPPAFGPPKTKASFRTVPAPDVVLESLTAHVATFQPGTDGLLLHNADGSPIGRNRFGDGWRETVEMAGLPKGTRYHDLRHHFASALIAAGCSVKAVQEALGHASAKETLDTYSHLWPSDTDRIRAAVDATLSRPADQSRTPSLR